SPRAPGLRRHRTAHRPRPDHLPAVGGGAHDRTADRKEHPAQSARSRHRQRLPDRRAGGAVRAGVVGGTHSPVAGHGAPPPAIAGHGAGAVAPRRRRFRLGLGSAVRRHPGRLWPAGYPGRTARPTGRWRPAGDAGGGSGTAVADRGRPAWQRFPYHAAGCRAVRAVPAGYRLMKHLFGTYLRGMAMGAADVVPGVSGGTIALITGIYEELIATLSGLKPSLLGVWRRQGFIAFWRASNI